MQLEKALVFCHSEDWVQYLWYLQRGLPSSGLLYIHQAYAEDPDQMFKITTLDFNNLPIKDKKVDFSKDLFTSDNNAIIIEKKDSN